MKKREAHRRARRTGRKRLVLFFSLLSVLVLGTSLGIAQSGGGSSSTPFGTPNDANPLPGENITAVRGDRANAWTEQTRSEVVARNGVVTTSQPLAVQAGLDILKKGGNAADAAVAASAVMPLVEPYSTSIAGDMFVLYWSAKDKKLYGLDASGRAPSGWTPGYFKSKGFDATTGMPDIGVDAITVPGSVDGWHELLKRFGTMGFKETLEPARRLSAQGFGVSERIAGDWASEYTMGRILSDEDTAETWLIDGKAPKPYQIFRNPDMADTYEILQDKGVNAFYRGEIAGAIVRKIRGEGGRMSRADLRAYEAEWVDPISTNYHGYDVHQIPPSSQGMAVLEMLNILEVCVPKYGLDLKELGPRSPQFFHLLVEAKKLAYADLHRHNADPRQVRVPVDRLISKEYAATLCDRIDPTKASTPPDPTEYNGGTINLSAADRWGNMVSFIHSSYDYFGSGLTVPGYGFPLHNRGSLFSLNPNSPNIVAPNKRPFNTIIPGFITKDDKPVLAFQNMGGAVQAQAQAKEVVDMVDLGFNIQAATDAARFSHSQSSNRLQLESNLFDLVGQEMRAMGHNAVSSNGSPMGGFQGIHFSEDPNEPKPRVSREGTQDNRPVNGVYRAGSDHRKDGQASGW